MPATRTEPTKVASKTFTAELFFHGSWGHLDAGKHESTMDLYLRGDATGFIEWDIPAIDHSEDIGLTFEIAPDGKRTLCDYDGIQALPGEAVDLMRENGITVPDEFDDRVEA